MKLRAVKTLIIHRRQRHSAVVVRSSPRRVAVDARRSSHVQTLRAHDEVVIVNAPKVRLGFTDERRAGGAMRLVANNQIEIRQPIRLRGGHSVQRLVGGEYDGHSGAVIRFAVSFHKSPGISGRGERQVKRREIAIIIAPHPTRASVGAYHELVE